MLILNPSRYKREGTEDFQYDATLYEKLKNEANWYLPKK